MKRLGVLSVLAVASSAVNLLGGPSVDAAGTFSGSVVGSDAAPLVGASILLVDGEVPQSPISAFTDANGAFVIADVPDGNWKVLVASPGYAATFAGGATYAAATSFSVTDGSTSSADVTLLRATAALSGVVTDDAGAPVADATVNVSVAGPSIGDADATHFSQSVSTDENGAFRVDGLAPGNSQVFVEAPFGSGLVSEFWQDSYDGANPTSVPLAEDTATDLANVVLDDGASISGVVRFDTGAPAAGAFVVSTGFTPVDAVADADGRFTLFPVAPGSVVLTASADDPDLLPVSSAPLSVSAGAQVDGVELVIDTDAAPPADTVPPTIACPAASSWMLNEKNATLTAAVSDDASGVDSPTVTVPVPTNAVGNGSVEVSAVDLAGNRASASCPFVIGVTIDSMRVASRHHKSTPKVKAGSNALVIWKAEDANGRAVKDPAHVVGLTAVTVTCPAMKGSEDTVHKSMAVIEPVQVWGMWIATVAIPAAPKKGCAEVTLTVHGDAASKVVRVH